jgi:hypothetical protein
MSFDEVVAKYEEGMAVEKDRTEQAGGVPAAVHAGVPEPSGAETVPDRGERFAGRRAGTASDHPGRGGCDV